jgi:hypothetical protein
MIGDTTYTSARPGFAIHFELRELSPVEPWGDRTSGLRLHWFGLTDGWYDVQIGKHRLFQTDDGDARGIDYYVVRLWEDLIEILPDVLVEIPVELADRLGDGNAWMSWTERAFEIDEPTDLYEAALSWWNARQLDSGHLRGAPTIAFWRSGEALHLRWRSHPRAAGEPVWPSPNGEATIAFSSFRDEVVRFDRALIDSMATRVEQVAHNWSRAEIEIDIEQLRQEQADRATWLERALTTRRISRSWDDVVEAVKKLELQIGSARSNEAQR